MTAYELAKKLSLIRDIFITGEEFMIDRYSCHFRVSKNPTEGLDFYEIQLSGVDNPETGGWWRANMDVNTLLDSKITRLPFTPKYRQSYSYWTMKGNAEFVVEEGQFDADEIDLARVSLGNCFRSKLDCLDHPEMKEKLIEMRAGFISHEKWKNEKVGEDII